jgi:hypothetical protein
MIDLSHLVGAAIQVVEMVELFCHEERLSDKLKYEIARNSMMLTVFTCAYGIKAKKERENFLGLWAKRVSDFESYHAYKEYVRLFENRDKFKRFEEHIEGLIVQFRKDGSGSPDKKD